MNGKTPFFVIGYPKTGTTYLTRLMGSILESTVGGSIPDEDKIEIAREGEGERDGGYIVRRGHFGLDQDSNELFVAPHRLGKKELYRLYEIGSVKGIILYRDPRDAVVSASHYYKHTIGEMLKDYGEGIGHMRNVGSFISFWNTWRYFPFPLIRYESLLLDPLNSLSVILFYNKIPYPGVDFLKKCVEENSIDRQKEIAVNYDYKRLLRNGKAGEWKDVFDSVHKLQAAKYFNEFLMFFSYESEENWWMEGSVE